MGRPEWQIKVITAFWPWRNLLARMVGLPVFGKWAARTFRGDRARYIPVRLNVEKPESIIIPPELVGEMISSASFRFLLKECVCRTLESCRKYPSHIGCLFLGEGAREIDPALGREAGPAEALDHYRRATEAGLVAMVGRLKWDSIWLGVKRRERLVTVCFCCECCCYFKMYRFLPREAAAGLGKLEGLEVRVGESCDGCGICVASCFMKAMTVQGGKAAPGEECRGCGRCAAVCPKQAVKVFIPAEVSVANYIGGLREG